MGAPRCAFGFYDGPVVVVVLTPIFIDAAVIVAELARVGQAGMRVAVFLAVIPTAAVHIKGAEGAAPAGIVT